MPPNDLVLYLVLAPEFGGTRFGPLEGMEVRIGSNHERSHIRVPESLGALADHARLMRQSDRSFILSPADRSAAVFLYKQDGRRAEQVLTATAVQPGDAFALVTPDGPRFRIELGPLPPALVEQRSKGRRGRRGLTVGRFFGEVQRMVLATLYTLSPVALATRTWYYISSGAIWHPRILITGLLMIAGWFGLGMASCSAMRYRHQVGIQEQATLECKKQLNVAGGITTDPTEMDFFQLSGAVLGSKLVGMALADDEELGRRVRQRARQLFRARDDDYAWLYGDPGQARNFRTQRERISKSDKFDEVTRRVLPYAFAWSDTPNALWSEVIDSQNRAVCGRGYSRLTWRQARNLGMNPLRLDALEQTDIDRVRVDAAERITRLMATWGAGRFPNEEPPPSDLSTDVAVVTQGESVCVHELGGDDRDDESSVVAALAAGLGESAKNVAPPGDGLGAVTRLAKLYAADLPGNTYGGSQKPAPRVDFASGTVSDSLTDVPGGDWVLDRTAEAIARAIVLPCRAYTLKGDREQREKTFGTLPEKFTCYVLAFESAQAE